MKKPTVNRQLLAVLESITRSAVFNMPHGIQAYAIADETMDTAKRLVEIAKHVRDLKRRKTSTLPNRASLNPGAVAELIPIEPSPFLVQTTSETLTAYADCAADNVRRQDAMRVRNLSFKSAHPVTVAEARAILGKAIVGGYNAFEPKQLRYLPQDRMVYLAREGSPCLYVLGAAFPQSDKLPADEFDFYPNEYVKTYGNNQFTIPGPVTRVWFD